MAPYPYLFAADIFSHMVNDPIHGTEGIILPNGATLTAMLFANDTALYLKGTRDNLDKIYKVLQLFCDASRARINWDRSFPVWASVNPRQWSWGEDLGLRWLNLGETARYLGFPVGFEILQVDRSRR